MELSVKRTMEKGMNRWNETSSLPTLYEFFCSDWLSRVVGNRGIRCFHQRKTFSFDELRKYVNRARRYWARLFVSQAGTRPGAVSFQRSIGTKEKLLARVKRFPLSLSLSLSCSLSFVHGIWIVDANYEWTTVTRVSQLTRYRWIFFIFYFSRDLHNPRDCKYRQLGGVHGISSENWLVEV